MLTRVKYLCLLRFLPNPSEVAIALRILLNCATGISLSRKYLRTYSCSCRYCMFLRKIIFYCDSISEEQSLSLANTLLEMTETLREVDLHRDDFISNAGALQFRDVVCVSGKEQVKICLSLKYWEGFLESLLSSEAKQYHVIRSIFTYFSFVVDSSTLLYTCWHGTSICD